MARRGNGTTAEIKAGYRLQELHDFTTDGYRGVGIWFVQRLTGHQWDDVSRHNRLDDAQAELSRLEAGGVERLTGSALRAGLAGMVESGGVGTVERLQAMLEQTTDRQDRQLIRLAMAHVGRVTGA